MKREAITILFNLVYVIERLRPGESISREALVNALRDADDPALLGLPDDAVWKSVRRCITYAGIKNPDRLVNYPQAAALAGTTVGSIKQAVYRGSLLKLSAHGDGGRLRSGVTLLSLAEWRRWSRERLLAAVRRLDQGLEAEA